MAELILVRHGQAMAFDADSDRLSELGHQQAKLLGEHWVQSGERFDAVISGALRRHRETEAGVRAAYEAAGLELPDAEIDPGWNEYDGNGLMRAFGPRLAAEDPAFAEVLEQALDASEVDRNRRFQRAFEVVVARWIAGTLADPEVESFVAFHQRVAEARERLVNREKAGRVAVFTSAGPIGVNIQLTLAAPAAEAVRLNYRVRNTSSTHFLFSPGRQVSLDMFNLVPHLTPDLITFR